MKLLVIRLPLAQLGPAILKVLVVGRRPIQVNAIIRTHHRIFPIPCVKLDDRTRSANHASPGGDLAHQHAIGAHRRRDVRSRIVGDDAPDVGLERAHFLVVA